MKLTHRMAEERDVALLAELNHQLIRDEGHRNPMTVPELAERMRDWLDGEYQAELIEQAGEPVAYVLFRHEPDSIYLRQFFVSRARRRCGIGRAAMAILLREVWPAHTRITLDVLVHNAAARQFWRAVGFSDYAVTMEQTT